MVVYHITFHNSSIYTYSMILVSIIHLSIAMMVGFALIHPLCTVHTEQKPIMDQYPIVLPLLLSLHCLLRLYFFFRCWSLCVCAL